MKHLDTMFLVAFLLTSAEVLSGSEYFSTQTLCKLINQRNWQSILAIFLVLDENDSENGSKHSINKLLQNCET